MPIYDGIGMSGWAILMSIMWLTLAVIAVWALVTWLGRASRGASPRSQGPDQPSALDILKARYARGESDTATYQSMREQLEYPAPTRHRSSRVPRRATFVTGL